MTELGIGSIKYPSNLTEKIAISFFAKQVDFVTDGKKLYEDTKKKLEEDGTQDKNGITSLAKKLLKNATTMYSCALPFPNQFTEDVRHGWSASEGLVSDVINNLANKSNITKALNDSGTKALAQAASLTGSRSPIVDPGFFQRYKGTEPRDFSFSWDFIIENEKDSDNVTNIIKNFKIYSAPESILSKIQLMSPNIWLIEVGNKYLKDSIKFQPVVIKSVSVDYGASQTMEVYYDGSPKYLRLSITCSEIAALTRAEYTEGDE